jgi:pyridoxine kinase
MTKKILTIGGSDPFAGGGVQTDLKTFENHQLFGLSALTCIATVENKQFKVHDLDEQLVQSQLVSLPKNSLDGIKIGLIHNPQSVTEIGTFLKENQNCLIVLDPVLAFKETASVYEKKYIHTLCKELFPLATVITPNLKEAELLTESKLSTEADLKKAAAKLYGLGAKAVVIKGGERLSGTLAVDVLFDGNQHYFFSKPKSTATTTNGAGCSFASAIAANLVIGYSLIEAVKLAKQYVYEAITNGVLMDSVAGSVWHAGKLATTKEEA